MTGAITGLNNTFLTVNACFKDCCNLMGAYRLRNRAPIIPLLLKQEISIYVWSFCNPVNFFTYRESSLTERI